MLGSLPLPWCAGSRWALRARIPDGWWLRFAEVTVPQFLELAGLGGEGGGGDSCVLIPWSPGRDCGCRDSLQASASGSVRGRLPRPVPEVSELPVSGSRKKSLCPAPTQCHHRPLATQSPHGPPISTSNKGRENQYPEQSVYSRHSSMHYCQSQAADEET